MSKQQELATKLSAEFEPHFLQVENESHMHSSGKGEDSHFKIVLVSAKFDGLRQVARHRHAEQVQTCNRKLQQIFLIGFKPLILFV